MIYVDIKGRCPQKAKMTSYAEDIINSFFTRNMKRDVYIDIQVSNKIEGDFYGLCSGDKTEVEIELSRRDENDELMTPELIAQNLAHELVHAKQFIKGQIDGYERYRRSTNASWEDHSETSYREQPWEVEAYDLEEALFLDHWYATSTKRT